MDDATREMQSRLQESAALLEQFHVKDRASLPESGSDRRHTNKHGAEHQKALEHKRAELLEASLRTAYRQLAGPRLPARVPTEDT